MGRRWFQLLKDKGLLAATKQFFLNHYGIKKPDPTLEKDAAICPTFHLQDPLLILMTWK
jgi:hypothetical protein